MPQVQEIGANHGRRRPHRRTGMYVLNICPVFQLAASMRFICCMVASLLLQKKEKRLQHAAKETEFLRLKRCKLDASDFEALKVIGRGAFGEVRRFLQKL